MAGEKFLLGLSIPWLNDFLPIESDLSLKACFHNKDQRIGILRSLTLNSLIMVFSMLISLTSFAFKFCPSLQSPFNISTGFLVFGHFETQVEVCGFRAFNFVSSSLPEGSMEGVDYRFGLLETKNHLFTVSLGMGKTSSLQDVNYLRKSDMEIIKQEELLKITSVVFSRVDWSYHWSDYKLCFGKLMKFRCSYFVRVSPGGLIKRSSGAVYSTKEKFLLEEPEPGDYVQVKKYSKPLHDKVVYFAPSLVIGLSL